MYGHKLVFDNKYESFPCYFALNILLFYKSFSFLFAFIVHTMSELKLTGNCLRGSRPLLSFDMVIDRIIDFSIQFSICPFLTMMFLFFS